MDESKDVWLWVFVAIGLLLLFGSFGMGGYGMMGFGMGIGFLSMVLFWGIIIWLVVVLINAANNTKKNDGDASEILKKRFASGEITGKQFDEMRKKLGK